MCLGAVNGITKVVRSYLNSLLLRAHNARFNRELGKWLASVDLSGLSLPQQTVVFNTVRSNPGTFHHYTDFFLGHCLARLGCRAVMLLDDGVLKHWDSVQRYRVTANHLNPMHEPHGRAALRRNVEDLKRRFAVPGFEVYWYSEILDGRPDESVDGDVQRYALASTLRHFEMGFFEADDPDQQAYRALSLENAKLSKSVGRWVVDAVQPDVYATSHGIYSTWGPAYRYVRNAGVKTLVYAHHPYHLGGFMLDDAPGGSLDRQALADYLSNAPFGDKERAEARDYLDSRYSHQASDTKEYFGDSQSRQNGVLKTAEEGFERTFGLFPNVAWDAIGDHLLPIYDSVIDWIVDTVREIARDGRHRLIVRFHPAENTRMKGTLSTEALVREKLPEVARYPNIEFIGAANQVDSYDLLKNDIDVALVYTGTLGAEAQPLGVPVVSAASGRFARQFVYIAEDQAAYRAILADPSSLLADFDENKASIVEAVMKYHYYISHELYFPVPLMSPQGRRLRRLDELSTAPHDPASLSRTLGRYTR